MPERTYREEQEEQNILHLRLLMKDLPHFLAEFFRSLAQSTSIRTRVGYAYDLKLFFSYLIENHPYFSKKGVAALAVSDLNQISAEDIDCFLEYITYYTKPDANHPDVIRTFRNNEKGKARKLAAVRSMFKYFYKRGKILANPAAVVDAPKLHEKKIVRLDVNEVASLLDEVETGENLTKHEKAFHESTRLRDLAMVTTMVGTGMRVSECVGINLNDLDFQNNGVLVTRKGGNQVTLYFGEEVREALEGYLEYRKAHPPKDEADGALFLSNRGTRITVRQVQNLVKKYASSCIKLKNISPHKLRSTYGTNLYRETGDIYLVADVLGHSDVNTTKKHYAEMEEERRKSAAKYIKLRRD